MTTLSSNAQAPEAPSEASRPERRGHLGTLRSLLPYLWPAGRPGLRLRVVVALCLLAAAKFANVYVPFLYKAAVDALSLENVALIVVPVGAIVAYGLARVLAQAFGELRDAVFIKVGQHAIRSVALQTFEQLHRLALRFHLERQTGGLSRAIERGTKGIQFLLTFSLFNILPTLFEILLVVGILLYNYTYWFGTLTLLTISGYIAFTLAITEWRTKFRRQMNDMDSEANTKAIDSLLNYETVKYFGNESHEARRYDASLARYEHAAIRSQTTLSYLNIGQGMIVSAGLIAVMLLAAEQVKEGIMTLGDFVLINTFLIQLYLPLNFLGFVYREIKQSLVDMEEMFKLNRVNAEINDRPGAKALKANGGEVEFENVDFSYEADRGILRDVSFRVPAGQTVAIVGPSGAGKSTISRILFRFYDVSAGGVRIDGQDIREVTQASLRDAIGIVPQDTVLFNDSIEYNIRYGNPGASDADVVEATRLAAIHDFIEGLPEGYRTPVGERGLKLSGGEKQRVAIARTILKGPRILLFDEATSALDSHTEREIQAALKQVSADRTTLVIAHRLSTVVDADEILVLDRGRIVERGRHAELLALEGHYSAMWARQQEAADYQERLAAALGSA
jgi:ATP-binding cassette subfamily B protein